MSKLYKRERLKKKKDICSFFKSETNLEFLSSSFFSVRIKVNGLEYSRFFIGIKRGNYTAVERNRFKRVVRELYRQNKSLIPKGFDCFILIKGHTDIAFETYQRDFIKLFQRVRK